ncbi:hypothetical protein VT84_13090 [Gemmata sp. SH-PL17]|uniref:hypothetical protein n=1 Tax=Gemmata sp. SH-PL17 TaxID=1630693 RepID=UPI0006961128|nr:hypothetical protein [Gemmata sp. SH-PL17]AMV25329.1 hypothetical protein VT84_13090 [Gemmata sp. SH-PL17]
MGTTDRERILEAARSHGAGAFNRLVRSASELNRPQRLRYWEEQFLLRLAEQARVEGMNFLEFVAIFARAELMPEVAPQKQVPEVEELFQYLERRRTQLSNGLITSVEWSNLLFMHCCVYPPRIELAMQIVEPLTVAARRALRDAIEERLLSEYRAFPVNSVCRTPVEWSAATERETAMNCAWAELFRRALAECRWDT